MKVEKEGDVYKRIRLIFIYICSGAGGKAGFSPCPERFVADERCLGRIRETDRKRRSH